MRRQVKREDTLTHKRSPDTITRTKIQLPENGRGAKLRSFSANSKPLYYSTVQIPR